MAASAEPMAKVAEMVALTLMPMSCAAALSSEQARMALPILLLLTKSVSAIMMTTGSAKRIMGSIQERSERPPEENQTTISLSCQERMRVISAAMKSDAARSGGRFTRAL